MGDLEDAIRTRKSTFVHCVRVCVHIVVPVIIAEQATDKPVQNIVCSQETIDKSH